MNDKEIYVFSEKVIDSDINEYYINTICPEIEGMSKEQGQRVFFKHLEQKGFTMSDFLLYLTTETALTKEIPESGILNVGFDEVGIFRAAPAVQRGYVAMRKEVIPQYPIALYILKVYFDLSGIDDEHKPTAYKSAYPKSNENVRIPDHNSFMLNTNDIYSNNGVLMPINADQYRLISALKIDFDKYKEVNQNKPFVVTLRNIAIYIKGGDAATEPTSAELAKAENMLDFFNRVEAYKQGQNGALYRFRFVHFDTVENVNINGQNIPKAYIIHNVWNVPNEFEIEYRQFKLPKGYAADIENFTLWAAITDKGKPGGFKTIDFEKDICKKLSISEKNALKRRQLIKKLQEMAKYYGYDDIKLQRIKYRKTVTRLLLELDD